MTTPPRTVYRAALPRDRVEQMTAKLRAAFHDSDTRSWAIVQFVVALLVVVSILLLAAELVWEDDRSLLDELVIIDDVIMWVFIVELTLRVATFRPQEAAFYAGGLLRRIVWEILGRLRYLMRPLNIADVLAVLAVLPALRGLRALRLLRLLRGVGFFRYANPFAGLSRSLSDNRLPFALAFSFLGLTIVMFGTTIYMVEHRYNDSVETLADGYWWAIVTITTVGFGDIAPVTVVGRVIAAILMIIGMFTLALFAGIVGHTMLAVVMTIRQEEFRMTGTVNHLVVCGYDPADRRLLDDIIQEIGVPFEGRMVVFAQGDRPTDIPPEFGWVHGDPTKETELAKVRMGQAAIAIIVGSRVTSPQQADATTILTAFTIRKLIKNTAAMIKRAQPLYVIAEILDSENVEHARSAGCDEVIETTRLGFSLLAHATSMPGTAAILSEVASRGSQSLYVGMLESLPPGATTFVEVATHLKEELGILLVGVRDPESGKRIVNPPSDFVMRDDMPLLYFAPKVVLPLKTR